MLDFVYLCKDRDKNVGDFPQLKGVPQTIVVKLSYDECLLGLRLSARDHSP